ncbi:probable inactive receptor kinase At1g48480 [Amborella trichopoda]|uniref:Protein kinase domain-containing protein n=1 Tax=Amborella trichopoda TaxID=13333 RepID=W1NF88_AMBTC|nr:probable inactive receptor kinase At1g48480 [Amborella trichopoda]ERM94146.1 hypothetical protein AMTR_s00010p00158940 [Amborella trichopoda]|eukprot:XP_006826909.1 probable inactive receptor kinase At1g48480 [Amborella trichopoda]
MAAALPLSLLLFILVSTLPLSKPDLEGDRAALLSLRNSVGRALQWNQSQSPCLWQGVTCEGNRVTVLRLPGSGLAGQIPVGAFGNLTHLRTLSLRFNALSGPLPSDLALCTDLRNLYFQHNQFSGEIPPFISRLQNLVRLNLAGNNFSGEIPASLNSLTRLGTLYLEDNKFTGEIPQLDLPFLMQFNVSFNALNGSIPAKLVKHGSTAFEGMSLCGPPLADCPKTTTDTPINSGSHSGRKKFPAGAIAGIVVGAVVILLLIVLVILYSKRKRSSKRTRAVDISTMKGTDVASDKAFPGDGEGGNIHGSAAAIPKEETVSGLVPKPEISGGKKLVFFPGAQRTFDLEELLRASAEVLGKGSFGTAYKAVLEMGTVVAVKRLKDVVIGHREYAQQIEKVGSMTHENLVPLRAYYFSKDEKLLVYDYMPMGSLSALLHGNRGAGRTPLNWETRSGIALGAARAIEYLHSQGSTVSHGNIKSSNILLTKDYEARVSDFGLAQLVSSSASPTANRVIGYRAPEVTDAHKISQKADVYSFGVLLLELLTGKPPSHSLTNEEGVDLPRWVQSVVREEWTAEVFDLELLRYQNVEEDMVQLLQLAMDCAAQYPDQRPSMREVVQRIEELRKSLIDEAEHNSSQRTTSVNDSAPPPSVLD